MILSKSFGYALRSILYVAMKNKTRKHITLDEIAHALSIPRHYLAKIMKRLVKKKIIASIKGPTGGFFLTEQTLNISLDSLADVTGEAKQLNSCVLRTRACDDYVHCPMHEQTNHIRNQWKDLLLNTTIRDLLKEDDESYVLTISAA